MRAVKPMLAEKIDEPKDDVFKFPFGDEGWVFEPKLDGHRLIAFRGYERVELSSRAGNANTTEYPEIAAALEALPEGTMIDGEVCWMLDSIQTSRQRLANLMSASPEDRAAHLRYVVFDVLEYAGQNVTTEPYDDRRALLAGMFPDPVVGPVLLIPSTGDGIGLWSVVELLRLEGVVAKPTSSRYREGERGTWKKIKRLEREQFTIVGWTAGDKGRSGMIGALVLAELQPDGTFRYAGKVGTGFTDRTLMELQSQLEPLIEPLSPFDRVQLIRAKQHLGPRTVTWVRPALRAEIEFSDRSDDLTPIFPSFKGVVW